ncbi:MAG TPA: NRDE family protein [Trebonia sp.]|nr:NRDE family protein [Trebonia sp.]
MCTVVLSLEPGERVPLRLLGVRDELTSRPWRPPGRHWPGSPLIGGIDELAGGTWLAVQPGGLDPSCPQAPGSTRSAASRRIESVPRVACLLNGRGRLADPARRRSRGELPLRAAAGGADVLEELAADPDGLAVYDPFHLICATPDAVAVLSWLGAPPALPPGGPAVRVLPPGTHMFTNAGHAYPADPGYPDDPAGEPKAAHFAEKFAAARPSADPALPVAQAWGDWLTLAAGDGLDPGDPAAIVVRRDLPNGLVYGTTSMTLIGLAADAVRYDFQPTEVPPDPAGCAPPGGNRHRTGRASAPSRGDDAPGRGRADGWYPVPV